MSDILTNMIYAFLICFFMDLILIVVVVICWKQIKFRFYSMFMTRKGYGLIHLIGNDRQLKDHFVKIKDMVAIDNKQYVTNNDVVVFKGKIPCYFHNTNVADPLNITSVPSRVDIGFKCPECEKEVNANVAIPFKPIDSETLDTTLLRAATAGGLRDFLKKNKMFLIMAVVTLIIVGITLIMVWTNQSMLTEIKDAGATVLV